jgi:hypothetical protein
MAVVFSTLFATQVARANDLMPSTGKSADATTADSPKDVTATSPVKDDAVTSVSPMRDSETTVAPFVRIAQPRAGSLAGATLLRSLHVGLAVSQAYDVYSTTTAIRRGAIELNPLLKNTVGSRAAFIGLKVAMTAGPIYEAEKLWKKNHRVAAIALMAASNGIMMAVAKHNSSVMKNAVIAK